MEHRQHALHQIDRRVSLPAAERLARLQGDLNGMCPLRLHTGFLKFPDDGLVGGLSA